MEPWKNVPCQCGTISRAKNGERLKEFAEQALAFKKDWQPSNWMCLYIFDAEAYNIDPMDKPALSEIFKELEFRSLALQILGEGDLGHSCIYRANKPRVCAGRPFLHLSTILAIRVKLPKQANTYKVCWKEY
jgi:hypothetical protein